MKDEKEIKTDRLGNRLDPTLPYARGELIASTQDDMAKLRKAWEVIHLRVIEQGRASLFNLSGLERGLGGNPEHLDWLDDEMAPALYVDRLTELGLEHLGGDADQHGIMVMNRQTGALLAATLVMVKPGETVVGVSPSHSHPAIRRAALRAGARFVDTTGVEQLKAALADIHEVPLIALTRLAVTYDIFSVKEIAQVVEMARSVNARVLMDDAGGARVGPAIFGQPRALELGVDVASTGLDKYGTLGPRVGLLGGSRDLVERVRACAFELGLEARPVLYPAVVSSLEQYRSSHVQELVESTKRVANELKKFLGDRVTETPVIALLQAEDILEIAMERAGISKAPIVPYEASAALSMLLLRDYGILTVHFAGLPPGTSSLLIKFLPKETVSRFGGPRKLAQAINDSLSTLSKMIDKLDELRDLLLGQPNSDSIGGSERPASS